MTAPGSDQAKAGAADIRVDIVSDVVCPWCVVGYRQLDAALTEASMTADIHWHPFELNPAMPAQGENLRDHLMAKYGISEQDSVAARAQLTRLGAEVGFAFNFSDDMNLYNTFNAHQLLHWAAASGHQHALKPALFDAYFTRRENIADHSVLAAVAARAGLDEAEAAAVLAEQRYAGEVRKAARLAIANGIRGVPAMAFNGSAFVAGARGVGAYLNILRQARPN